MSDINELNWNIHTNEHDVPFEKISLKIIDCEYEGIKYQTADIDNDFIGWKYKPFPFNDDTVIIINDSITIVPQHYINLNDPKIIKYNTETNNVLILNDILFDIQKWTSFDSSPINTGFTATLIIINKEINNLSLILKIIMNHIKQRYIICQKSDSWPKSNIGIDIGTLCNYDGSFTICNNIKTNMPICINLIDKYIKNI